MDQKGVSRTISSSLQQPFSHLCVNQKPGFWCVSYLTAVSCRGLVQAGGGGGGGDAGLAGNDGADQTPEPHGQSANC